MKKVFFLLFAVLLSVLLCSCESVPGVQTLTEALRQPYEAEAEIQDGDDVYTVSVDSDANSVSFCFFEPALLRGVIYGFTDGRCSMDYNGLCIPVDPNGAQDGLYGGVLVWKKLLAAEGEYTVRRTADNFVMTDGKTEYLFDKQKKAPVYIKSGDITITFISFRAKNDKTS